MNLEFSTCSQPTQGLEEEQSHLQIDTDPFAIHTLTRQNRRYMLSLEARWHLGSNSILSPPRPTRTNQVLEKYIISGNGSVMAKREEARKKSSNRPTKKRKTVSDLNKQLQEQKSLLQLFQEVTSPIDAIKKQSSYDINATKQELAKPTTQWLHKDSVEKMAVQILKNARTVINHNFTFLKGIQQ
jgi:hypothetical protein